MKPILLFQRCLMTFCLSLPLRRGEDLGDALRIAGAAISRQITLPLLAKKRRLADGIVVAPWTAELLIKSHRVSYGPWK